MMVLGVDLGRASGPTQGLDSVLCVSRRAPVGTVAVTVADLAVGAVGHHLALLADGNRARSRDGVRLRRMNRRQPAAAFASNTPSIGTWYDVLVLTHSGCSFCCGDRLTEGCLLSGHPRVTGYGAVVLAASRHIVRAITDILG